MKNESDTDSASDEEFDVEELEKVKVIMKHTLQKNKKEIWHSQPLLQCVRQCKQNVLKENKGPSRFANREVDKSLESAFFFFFSKTIIGIDY